MNFKNAEQLGEFISSREAASTQPRNALSMRVGKDLSYFSGCQWIQEIMGHDNRKLLSRLPKSMAPDAQRLRATINRTTKYVMKGVAATEPTRIYTDVDPSESSGEEGMAIAAVSERLINAGIDLFGYLNNARKVNLMRGVVGTWCMGLCLDTREGPDGESYSDLKFYNFSPERLILDPFQHSGDLRDHDEIIYEDVWTRAKIRRVFGTKPFGGDSVFEDDSEWRLVGDLTPHEQEFNRLTNGRLYSHYKQHSKSRGARVYQVHTKDRNGRYTNLSIAVKMADGQTRWVNSDNPISPYGGDGLPIEMFHLHPRAMDPFGISHTSMLMDDQDRLNLLGSMFYRILQKHSGFQVFVDKRTIPRGETEDEVRNRFSNQVGGVVMLDMGDRQSGRQMPQFAQPPSPPPFIREEMAKADMEDMREQVFRAEGHMGQTKSHVSASAFNRAIEEADQVLGAIVLRDVESHQRMCRTLLATMAQEVQNENADLVGRLNKRGFDGTDYAVIGSIDATDPQVNIRIREGSIRFRSHNQRKVDLNSGMQMQAITPLEYRRGVAEIDAPLIQDDGHYLGMAKKAAIRVRRGEEWQPIPLGQYTEFYLAEFRRAMSDPSVQRDAESLARLRMAHDLQKQLFLEEMAVEQGAASPAPEQPTGDLSLTEILAGLDSGSGSADVGAQPATVPA